MLYLIIIVEKNTYWFNADGWVRCFSSDRELNCFQLVFKTKRYKKQDADVRRTRESIEDKFLLYKYLLFEFSFTKADVSMTKAVIYITFTQFKVSAANEQHCFVFVFLMLKFSIFFNSWHTYL